jgi:hypothetical protein
MSRLNRFSFCWTRLVDIADFREAGLNAFESYVRWWRRTEAPFARRVAREQLLGHARSRANWTSGLTSLLPAADATAYLGIANSTESELCVPKTLSALMM